MRSASTKRGLFTVRVSKRMVHTGIMDGDTETGKGSSGQWGTRKDGDGTTPEPQHPTGNLITC